MHRGHTSATVVPSASDEQNGSDKPLSSDASRINEAAGRRHSALAAPLNGGGDAPPSQSQTTPAPTRPASAAPVAGTAVRQPSLSVFSQKKAAAALTKNYPELVKGFKQLQPYTRGPDKSYPSHTRCIYCTSTRPTAVFFPCQHMCVCNDCIKATNLSPDDAHSSCLCPVCMTDIRLILPHTGKEEDKYWKWVMEDKPSLPSHFKQEFKEAGKNLRKISNAPAEPAPRRSTIIGSFIHKISSPATDAENGSLPSGRRHSWHPGARATTYNAAASKEQEEAHTCVIL